MRYLRFRPDRPMAPHVMADAAGVAGTVLELSHWPGNRTPPPYRADTSTESVIRYLGDETGNEPAAEHVSCDHYDVDGLLSVWAMTRPERALELSDDLIAAATSGDFDVYTSERGVRACLALVAVEETDVQPRMHPSLWGTARTTAFLFEQLLPWVEPCVADPDRHEALWADELGVVQRSRESIASGAVELHERPDIDLAWVRSDRPVHPFALHEATERHRILESWEGSRHRLRYRYETFVELESRPVSPRVPLDALATRIAELEPRAGTWFAEPVDSAHPSLQFYTADGTPGASGLEFERVLELVSDHLEAGADRADAWTPGRHWRTRAHVLPPSLDRHARG